MKGYLYVRPYSSTGNTIRQYLIPDGWCEMSRMVLEAVTLTRRIPHTPKCVLIALAAHARHDGSQARPSQQTIAELMDISPRSVRNGLAWLERNGYILPTGHDSGGRGCAVEYQISLAMLQNVAPHAAFHGDNPATDATFTPETRQNQTQNPARNDVNPANSAQNPAMVAAQSGKNQKKESKEEESAEHADDAEASRVLLSFSSSHKKIESYAEAEEVATNGGKNLYAPFTDEECDFFTREHLSEEPCWHERAVLYALWLGSDTDADGPSRAWGQYAGIFLESGATPREIEVGYILLRQQAESQNWEHMPGVKYLAEHWDEWRSKAKRQNAEDDAYARYWDEQDRQRQREEEARQWQREARAAEQARRDALTPEERAAEDAAQAAAEEAARAVSERLHQERMAFMRAKLAGTG